MKRPFLQSMYVKFVVAFLGLFIFSITCGAIVITVTQYQKVETYVKTMMSEQAERISKLVEEQNINVEQALTYFSTPEFNIRLVDEDTATENFTDKEQEELKQGNPVLQINKTKIHVLVKIQDQYVYIAPDIENSPISQFIKIQKMAIIFPILIGSILIVIAVRRILKPIRQVSEAAEKVQAGNFDVEVDVIGKDELGQLSENFNRMVKELSRNEYLHRQFVSNVSHEFKTPITSLIGYAKLLKRDGLSPQKQEQYVNIILAESERLGELSSNMLKLSELENEHFTLKKESYNLANQLREILILLQPQWEEKELELDLQLEDMRISGDQSLLFQVWMNLLSNAIKFSHHGGTLSVTAKMDEYPIVEIRDKGIGMTEEEQAQIFTRFYKGDKSRQSTGTGLGLSIAKKIIDLSGGTINVTSEKEKGTTFKVTLQ